MLALVVTLLFALYLLGPDLLARWVLGFVVQRKSLIQSRSEEITRAIIWAVFPLIGAYIWATYFGHLWLCGGKQDLEIFFSGIYSASFFQQNRISFFDAARAVAWMNACLLWRLYAIVLTFSVTLDFVLMRYGRIRHRLKKYPKTRRILTTLVAPRVSEWHLLLSDMLLPSNDLELRIDAMTKGGMLYQGQFADRLLGPDGSLVSITLREPKRFKRDQYLAALKDDPKTNVDDFWKAIPGNIFVVMGSEISTLNLRYTPQTLDQWADFEDVRDVLRKLSRILEEKKSEPAELDYK